MLDERARRVAAHYDDELAPAIERVWDDGIASIRADLREWLRRATEETVDRRRISSSPSGSPNGATATRRASTSRLQLDCGIRLRGSIDLVERRA